MNKINIKWEEYFQKAKQISVIEKDFLEIINQFKEIGIRKVLDLACGSGKHVIHLSKNNFDVYGFDISEKAIELARFNLRKNDLHGSLQVGSMFERLPYRKDFFDAITCIRSLNHGTIENIRKAIIEIQRVLKPNGLFYLTVRNRVKGTGLPCKEITRSTYIPLEGLEKGIIHYSFSKDTLLKEFEDFQSKKIWVINGPESWESYFHLLIKL
ncbi:MAG: class I SAM-dependent methyltransferase [Promethearchaeota archaeon]